MSIDPLYDAKSKVTLVESMGSDLSIVQAARRSLTDTDSFAWRGLADENLIAYMLKHKHFSPFEHTALTFNVKAPLYIVRQWQRHRSWAFNELSGRYTNLAEGDYYTPSPFRLQAASNRQASYADVNGAIDRRAASEAYHASIQQAFGVYKTLLELGVCREQARGVLPQAMYTQMYATANLRSLLHFLEQRDSPHAQWEMTQYAQALITLAEPIFPVTFAAWRKGRA